MLENSTHNIANFQLPWFSKKWKCSLDVIHSIFPNKLHTHYANGHANHLRANAKMKFELSCFFSLLVVSLGLPTFLPGLVLGCSFVCLFPLLFVAFFAWVPLGGACPSFFVPFWGLWWLYGPPLLVYDLRFTKNRNLKRLYNCTCWVVCI